jgi:hypothetical protein
MKLPSLRAACAFCLAALVLPLALCGCGIETYVYLYPVTQLPNGYPSSTAGNAVDNFFQFRTSDSDNSGNSYFRGFEIYYRIYNSLSTRSSDVSTINTYNENNPTTAMTYLINTKNYHRMVYSARQTDIPLIPGTSSDRTVSIRLFAQTPYIPYFSLDGTTDGSGTLGIPERTHNSGTSYEPFFETDDQTKGNISSSDDDVTFTSGSGESTWYVQAYVAAYGYDESYKSIYSEIFNLGYVTITQ